MRGGGGSLQMPRRGSSRGTGSASSTRAPSSTSTGIGGRGVGMNAAALQQHLSLNLGMATTLGGPAQRRRKPPTSSDRQSSGNSQRRQNQQNQQNQNQQQQQQQTVETNFFVDDDDPATLERARQRHQASLTLAERYGLVQVKEDDFLSDEQWRSVRLASQVRGDAAAGCPICREPFKLEEQVLLSCSHSFHAQCISSFERFIDSIEHRCCPLCRRERYRKVRCGDGAEHWRRHAAESIQKCFRGWTCRRKVYKKHFAMNKKHRNAFYAANLSTLSDRMLKQMGRSNYGGESGNGKRDRGRASPVGHGIAGSAGPATSGGDNSDSDVDDLDAFLAELDESTSRSRAVMDNAERMLFCPAGEQMENDLFHVVAAGADTGSGSSDKAALALARAQHAGGRVAEEAAAAAAAEAVRWATAKKAAIQRDECECPICFMPFDIFRSSGEIGVRGSTLLSCSHVFHSSCVKAFEDFAARSGVAAPLCPICRAMYDRIAYCTI